MILIRLKAAVLSKVIAGLVSALALVNLSLVAEEPAAKKDTKTGMILVRRQDVLVALTPEGKKETELSAPMNTGLRLGARLSPDGAQVAFIVGDNDNRPSRPPWRWGEVQPLEPFKAVVQRLGAAKPTAIVSLPAYDLMLTWAPDGKRLLVTKMTLPRGWSFETMLVDAATGEKEQLDLPADVRVLDWSHDGKTFLVVQREDKKYRLGLMVQGDKKVRDLIELKEGFLCTVARFSPDDRKVLYIDADPTNKDADRWGWSDKVYLLDVAAKKQEALAGFPLNGRAQGGVAWSPDGKRIAYTWKQLHPELLKKGHREGLAMS